MKTRIFTMLIVVIALLSSAQMVFAGSTSGTISASSDCTTLTANWAVTGVVANDNLYVRFLMPSMNTTITSIENIPESGSGITTFNRPSTPSPVITVQMINVNTLNISVVATTDIQCAIPVPESDVATEPVEPTLQPIGDGRIEPFPTNRVIYPILNTGIVIYNDEGGLALFVPIETIDAIGVPTSGSRLLGETADGYVQVYRLADGRFQVYVGPDDEGKVHVVYWTGLGFIPAGNITSTTFIAN